LCLLVAVLATGCETLRGVRTDRVNTPIQPRPIQPNPTPNDYRGTEQLDTIPGGTVVGAGGTGAPQGLPAIPQMPAPGAPLAQPRPVPPGWPPGVPVPPNGQPPLMMPPVGVPGSAPFASGDPHLRGTPTVAGGRWGLGPNEMPADRLLELTRNLDAALAQNRELLARIKELEALGVGREQALAEAVREIEALTAEAAKTRAALQAQVLALQGKIKTLEDEDIIFLRAVIDALGKLLPPERK
jgi:hypothetical protein